MPGARADAATKPRSVRGFVVFRWVVYALLACDVVLYARFGRATELIDSAAWFVLLLLFEWETGGWRMPAWARLPVHAIRLLASAAIVAAVVGYAQEWEWLDFANETVWLGVVVLLELDVRLSPSARRRHRWRSRFAALLYLALLGFMLAWLVDGIVGDEPLHALLDAGDALLWLVAFVAIELNVFGLAPPRPRRGDQPAPLS